MTRLALLAALLLPLAAQAQDQDSPAVNNGYEIPADAPAWLSVEGAIAAAQDSDKLVLVYGYAAWCGYCVRFDREVFTDDAVQAYVNEHFAPARLDLEDTTTVQFFDASVTGVELGRAMGISGTPTTVFVDRDGSLITKFPGYTDAETFLYALQYVKEAAYETTPFDAFLAARRAGIDATPKIPALSAPPAAGVTSAPSGGR